MAKENIKLINDLQKLYKKGEFKLKSDFIKKYKIENLKNLIFRNLKISKSLFGSFSIVIINELDDLNGVKISKNSKLNKRLRELWNSEITEINFSELSKLDISTPAQKIEIGNFHLQLRDPIREWHLNSECYKIKILDSKKNSDNLMKDSNITKEKIISILNDFTFNLNIYTKNNEVKINNLLEKHFRKYFLNVRRSSLSNKGLIDLVIGEDNNFGIEIKLARELLKSNQCDRAIGQHIRYSEEFNDNFLIIIFGTLDEKSEKYVQYFFKKVGKPNYYYKET